MGKERLRKESVDSRYERDSAADGNTSNYLVQTPFSNKNSKSKSAAQQIGSNHHLSTQANQPQFDVRTPRQRLNFDNQHPGTSPARSGRSVSHNKEEARARTNSICSITDRHSTLKSKISAVMPTMPD